MSPTVQEMRPLFFDHDALRIEPRKLYRVDYEDRRQYYTVLPDRSLVLYNSVTTILTHTMKPAPGLIDWIVNNGGREQARAVLQEHADYGTFLHSLCTEFCLKGSIDLNALNNKQELFCDHEEIAVRDKSWIENAKNDLLCFAEFVHERNVKPLAIEILLASDTFGFAGALDLICRMDWDGKQVLAIVDYKKTRKGFSDSHAIQLAAYHQLMKENFPDIAETVYLFNWGPKEFRGMVPTFQLKDQSDADGTNWHRFEIYNHLYQLEHSDDEEAGLYREFAGTIEFGKAPDEKNIIKCSVFDALSDNKATVHQINSKTPDARKMSITVKTENGKSVRLTVPADSVNNAR